ncbi:ATP-binding cassette sub-family D member 3-like isoform X2 [Amphibalanus amphitrite]|nr:ATP-binding cassette sub-family D member 3-like isoform X2 [Amphibalanus amphitrite]XP_043215965.1 ATP-binding cassette sub-family D member 3-like isoform X2 [Amphibalanus amphitrite]XP_043215966.1 ATP-binding cassette sub-family D member 3-like isoform X2 [Amphibalanus amphitrite]XP_043215967.1 ATP-binding cassette sub-family D member 3-like isoform X2 [Amphibalanus amphitrite]XP_043215968.1 ATP-binding cassette sub-family D member 3-like isoform X2 [Amphibalanus amphitrite]XP_043215969.1 
MPGVWSKLTPEVVGRIPPAAAMNALSGAAMCLWIGHFLKRYAQRQKRIKTSQTMDLGVTDKASSKKERAAVDAVFFRRLRRLLGILIPGPLSSPVAYIVLVALVLVARTACDVWLIKNHTMIETSLIGGSRSAFLSHAWDYTRMMPVVSLINNLLKYSLNQLQLDLRVRLTRHLYDQYMKGYTFYQMNNLDNRIQNADHLLTNDVNQFCTGLVDLYSNLSKPLLDIVLYVQRLSAGLGRQVPGYMIAYLLVSGLFLTNLRRPVGSMTVKEQKLEAEYRFVNSRLITNCEEVAFYQGSEREKITLNSEFRKLIDHMKTLLHFKFSVGFVDNIIAKYLATLVGCFTVSIPFLAAAGPMAGLPPGQRQQRYYENGRMMVRLAESIGRLVLAGREMTRLSGFTVRISKLLEVLNDLNNGHYERTMLTPQSNGLKSSSSSSSLARPVMALDPKAGKVVLQDHIIRFEHVPLVTPNGDVLVQELNFEVRSGMNVLVCGPNGCGKSSLFRILGELWPVFGGTLTKPDRSQLFYIPQRPYMTLGTLRDQVIYPDTVAAMRRRGRTDEWLLQLLEEVQLGYIHERENGWDAVADWGDVLSGGEKQRVAMARLFYHRPQFAILDECTSAVSVDVEGSMYSYCRKMGITLFTVSHRKSLWVHHEYYLQMDGRGEFVFKPITEGTDQFGS